MDLDLFIGRFHPLVVHLPISFILLGGVMYILSQKKQFQYLDSAVSFVLLLGSMSAIVAAFLGWLIAEDKGYDADTLFLHRWFGIAVAVGSIFLWLFKTGKINSSYKRVSALALGLIAAVSITGHLGGNLTHGDGYLTEHAPPFVKSMLPDEEDKNALSQLPTSPDSVIIYQDIISPIIQTKCGSCHDESQKKGGLNVLTISDLSEGGDNGEVIIPGKAFESSLFLRTTLPSTHKKFMPLSGTPLTFTEIGILQWWIDAGASFEAKLTDTEVSPVLSDLLIRDYNFSVIPKPFYETISIDLISEESLTALQNNQYVVRPIAADINYLDIGLKPNQDELSSNQLEALLQVSDHIIWLDLNGSGLQNDHLKIIGQLKNLIRLNINSNEISDEGLGHLSQLNRLETLNLYNTKVSDSGLSAIETMTSLKRLYLWQTAVTPAGVDQLKNKLESLQIDTGILSQAL